MLISELIRDLQNIELQVGDKDVIIYDCGNKNNKIKSINNIYDEDDGVEIWID